MTPIPEGEADRESLVLGSGALGMAAAIPASPPASPPDDDGNRPYIIAMVVLGTFFCLFYCLCLVHVVLFQKRSQPGVAVAPVSEVARLEHTLAIQSPPVPAVAPARGEGRSALSQTDGSRARIPHR